MSGSPSDQSALFQQLVEHTLDGIATFGLDGMLRYTNQAFVEITGMQTEHLQEPIAQLFSGNTSTIVYEIGLPSVREKGSWSGQILLRRPVSGEDWMAQVNVTLVQQGAAESEEVFAVIVRDITNQQQMTKSLAESEHYLRTILGAMTDAVLILDREGVYVDIPLTAVNKEYIPRDSLIGKKMSDFFSPEVTAQYLGMIAQVIDTGKSELYIYPLPTPNGEAWFSALISRLDEQHVVWVARDITTRRLRDSELRESQRRLNSLLNNLPGMVYRSKNDQNWSMEFVSSGTLKLTGYPAEDFLPDANGEVRQVFSKLIVPSEREQVRNEIWRAVNAHERYEVVYAFTHANGQRCWAWEQGAGVYDDDGTLIALEGYIVDITEPRNAEEERTAMQEQIIAAQQAALRELGTPLIPISEGVMAMPLIGSIDSSRAQQIMETLLTGTAAANAEVVILDITGVPVVDTQVADALLRATQAVKLLGTRAIITGIRPEVAQTLVGLGLDMSGIMTLSSLQAGISFALRRRG